MDQLGPKAGGIETRESWVVAWVALAVLTVSNGAPLATVVALKPIAAEFGTARSAPALSLIHISPRDRRRQANRRARV